YNKKHGITPQTVKKAVRDVIEVTSRVEEALEILRDKPPIEMTKAELADYAKRLEKEMKEAAKNLEFEKASIFRDRLFEIRASIS
ncbi:MAG TPA: UvrB/UvrC motif-containing protein, partial [Bacillota bacterium]|nr:UvrB/UvrC motif-containing protein [Bacillota bacterium]